jgi:hypothetical protein
MKKLISAMAKPGFSWPICHAANAGKPGHEEYDECPAGMTAESASNASGRDNEFGGNERQICTKTVNQCRNRAEFRSLYGNKSENAKKGIEIREVQSGGGRDNSFSSGDACEVVISQPRPRRADPYYFDIPDDKGVKKRVWFNLNP